MVTRNEQPEPRGTTVSIPLVSHYFSKALGWDGPADVPTVTGRHRTEPS